MSLQEPSHNSSTASPEHPARKRPVSERRIQANRRNALRSTGPKTARGKRAVSRNAITHGLLAREVVIAAGDGEESLEEFHAMVEGLSTYYEPVGVVEEWLVQTIATCWWRKARVLRAENGEIRRRLDTLQGDRALRTSDKGNFDVALSHMDLGLYDAENPADQKISSRERWSGIQSAQTDMRSHISGVLYMSVLLHRAKSEIVSAGYISEETQKKILLAFCFWDYPFTHACLHARPPETKAEGVPPKDSEDKQAEKERGFVLELIDTQLERMKAFGESALDREDLQGDAEARSFSLPSADATDKLLRYEAHLDRQLYRAMDQLERLQRQRRGENLPPPLNINLGKRS
jgi:hypothetical protein